MELYKDYVKLEEGYDCISTDNAFCTYSHAGDEFFIAHFYVKDRSSGKSYKFFNEVCEKAKALGAKYLTGNIDMNEANRDRYTEKLMIQLRHGYKILSISDNRITVYKEL